MGDRMRWPPWTPLNAKMSPMRFRARLMWGAVWGLIVCAVVGGPPLARAVFGSDVSIGTERLTIAGIIVVPVVIVGLWMFARRRREKAWLRAHNEERS